MVHEPKTPLAVLLDRLWLQATDDLSDDVVASLGDDPQKLLEVGYKMGVTNALQVIGGERRRRPIVRDAIREAVAFHERLDG